jgi:signal transduction histidine kinase
MDQHLPMTHRRATWLAAVAWLAVLVAAGQAALLLGLTWTRDLPDDLFGGVGGVAFLLLAVACATAGAAIVVRVRGNAVGPVFVALGVLVGGSLLAYQYAAYAIVADPAVAGGATAAWLSMIASEPAAPLLGLALLTFPDGRLPSARWWPARTAAFAAVALLVISDGLAPGPVAEPFAVFSNPVGIAWAEPVTAALNAAGWALALAVVAAGVVALSGRGRHARPDQRAQLRLVLVVGVPAGAVILADMIGWVAWKHGAPQVGMAIIGVAFSAFAVAVAVAVVRLRLLHERRRIDRFVADVGAGRADPEEIEPLLAAQVHDPTLTVGYVLPGVGGVVDRNGRPLRPASGTGRTEHEVVRTGERLAVIDCATSVPADVLAELADQGAPALDVGRLRIGLRRQLDDLAAARARVAEAAEAERRRIQRDLHDGAQARLISVGLALRNLRRDAIDDPVTAQRLDCAVDELAGAITQLRELSAGLPPSLLDAGLGPALVDLAHAVPVAVHVDVTPERFAPGIESTAYFVACEGLANAIKHSRAGRVDFDVRRAADRLVIRVADDGVGGAHAGPGGGLAGLHDRVAAHGGRLAIDSRRGGGTTLVAELPCAS